jgi:hypothetical protein
VPLAARPHLVQVLGLTNAFRPSAEIRRLRSFPPHMVLLASALRRMPVCWGQ